MATIESVAPGLMRARASAFADWHGGLDTPEFHARDVLEDVTVCGRVTRIFELRPIFEAHGSASTPVGTRPSVEVPETRESVGAWSIGFLVELELTASRVRRV